MINRGLRRCLPVAGVVAALLTGVSGCARGSDGYTIPKRVCAAAVDGDLLAPLLPDGEELVARRNVLDDGHEQCLVSVDGQNVLSIDEYRDQKYFDALEHARETRLDRRPEASGGAPNAAVADGDFLAVTPCTDRGADSHHVLEVALTRSGEKAGEQRDELERFALSYIPAGLKKLGCRT